MTIGKQFENTFWEDPSTGKTHTWSRLGDSAGVPQNRPTVATTGPDEAPPSTGTPHQGLLFHPLTGTGLPGDPMTPEHVRRGVIQKVFNFLSPEQYKENLGRIVPSQRVDYPEYQKDASGNPVIESVYKSQMHGGNYRNPEGKTYPTTVDPDNPNKVLRQAFKKRVTAKISNAQAQKHMDWVTDAASETDIPTHVIGRRAESPMKVVLDPTPGRAYIEGNGGNIRLTYPRGGTSRTRTVEVETHEPSSTPLHNPKFWTQLDAARDKADGDTHEELSADDAFKHATHWVHPETKHVLTSEEAIQMHKGEGEQWSKEQRGANPQSTPALYLRHLGYVPNLFAGAPNTSSPNYAFGKTTTIEVGYGDWGRDYRQAKFHTRFEPDTTKPKRTIRERVTTREAPAISKTTIIHEVGHALDPSLGDVFSNQHLLGTTADPLKEGIADATADRYVRYQGQYADALANNERRLREFGTSGYSTNYSGWKTNLHKALYVGARYHAALGDDNAEQLPSREVLARTYADQLKAQNPSPNEKKTSDLVNTLALGHMYDKFTHIHGILRQAGLEPTAQKAHAEYLKLTRGESDQPALPGMEKFLK